MNVEKKFTRKEIQDGWNSASLLCTATLNELLENNEEVEFFVVDSCDCGMVNLVFAVGFGFCLDGTNCVC